MLPQDCLPILSVALVASTLLFRVSRAEDDGEDSASVGEDRRPICFAEEPCQYLLPSRAQADSIFSYKKIDTWCRCSSSQKCRRKKYHAQRQAVVYTCRERSKRRHSANRRVRVRLGRKDD